MAKRKSPQGKPSQPIPATGPTGFERLSSGIPGLDEIVGGGLLKGGTYLILGHPGTGKTILANQLSFSESQQGRRALYVTLLAENHSRMFGHLESLDFFDRSQISESIQFVSGYGVLEKDGLDGLMKLLGALVHRHKSTLLFIDGVASASDLSGSEISFKKFVHNLNTVLGMSGCTTFLLSSSVGDPTRPEYTMVDGIIKLTMRQTGMQVAREIEILKFRGSPHLYGQHFFDITEHGISIYPRVEAVIGRAPTAAAELKKTGTGTQGLDALFDGGVVRSSVTALLGPSGSGKTTLGMRFLAEGAKKGERGLLVSFYEDPRRLEPKLNAIGSSIAPHLKSGMIEIYRRPPAEILLDKIIHEILGVLSRKEFGRVFIDGAGALRTRGALGSDRLREAMRAMCAELRSRGLTTFFVEETDVEKGPSQETLTFDSAISDNIVEFKSVYVLDRRAVAINVLKNREGSLDPHFFEFTITAKGPSIGRPLVFHDGSFPVARYRDKK